MFVVLAMILIRDVRDASKAWDVLLVQTPLLLLFVAVAIAVKVNR